MVKVVCDKRMSVQMDKTNRCCEGGAFCVITRLVHRRLATRVVRSCGRELLCYTCMGFVRHEHCIQMSDSNNSQTNTSPADNPHGSGHIGRRSGKRTRALMILIDMASDMLILFRALFPLRRAIRTISTLKTSSSKTKSMTDNHVPNTKAPGAVFWRIPSQP